MGNNLVFFVFIGLISLSYTLKQFDSDADVRLKKINPARPSNSGLSL